VKHGAPNVRSNCSSQRYTGAAAQAAHSLEAAATTRSRGGDGDISARRAHPDSKPGNTAPRVGRWLYMFSRGENCCRVSSAT